MGARLTALAEGGVRLAPGRTPADIAIDPGRELVDPDAYCSILVRMGGLAPGRGAGYISDDIWHFDTECIEGDGAYVAIASRLSTLAKGNLPLTTIKDYVDIEEGRAWLAFELDGTPYRWEPTVEGDWVDPSILTRLADLLIQRSTGYRFTYINLGGQDCLIGCATEEQLGALRSKTGLTVSWLR
jgi:hypothetical protein